MKKLIPKKDIFYDFCIHGYVRTDCRCGVGGK